MIDIRLFASANARAVSSLARQVFDEHVAPDFEPEGITEMHAFIAPEEIARRAKANTTLVAWDGTQAAGMLQMRDSGHISILFVETSHMGQGIATAMMDLIEAEGRTAGCDKITVNSSLNAQGYYEQLGFAPTAGPQRLHGFSFIPMEKLLNEKGEDTHSNERIDEMLKDRSIFTQAVRAGERQPRPDYTPVSTPIQHSVGYLYDRMDDLDGIFGGERAGFVYPRYGSPTVGALEEAIATLEGAEDAVAFSSGMAAVHAALMGAGVRTGASVVAAADVYGATYALLDKTFTELGVQVHFVDITDIAQVTEVVEKERPVALLCEIVSNPLMKVADVPTLAELAHSVGAALIVDSTFASPYLFRPVEHATDYAVHSATKYFGGHGDVMAGVVACSADRGRDMRERQKLLGANLGPQEAWLVLRGLKTLPLRMRQHCANAEAVAQWLDGHPGVTRVNYPGLPEHPQHTLASRLFGGRGFGAMMSFDLRDAGQAKVFRLLEALELVLPATTLGDVYSLTLYPAHSSHRQMTPEVRDSLGIGDGLVRLSVGIEDPEDIIADLAQGLDVAMQAG